MTRLYINEQEITPLPPDLTSLDQVLNLVETAHLPRNTIIRQVQIDGHPLIAGDQAAPLPSRIDDRDKIEIFTGTLREVALDSLQDAITFLERVETATPSFAASCRNHDVPAAFENLKQLYEGFYWVNLLLDRLERSFEIPMNSVCAGSGSARQHHMKLAAALKALIEAQEKRDLELVADLLEYEISPMMPACKGVLAAVRERILAKE